MHVVCLFYLYDIISLKRNYVAFVIECIAHNFADNPKKVRTCVAILVSLLFGQKRIFEHVSFLDHNMRQQTFFHVSNTHH